ncbi:hypothetical protein DsansV1_C01g0002061 [Dioscorea sansibarensis]
MIVAALVAFVHFVSHQVMCGKGGWICEFLRKGGIFSGVLGVCLVFWVVARIFLGVWFDGRARSTSKMFAIVKVGCFFLLFLGHVLGQNWGFLFGETKCKWLGVYFLKDCDFFLNGCSLKRSDNLFLGFRLLGVKVDSTKALIFLCLSGMFIYLFIFKLWTQEESGARVCMDFPLLAR